MAASHILSTLRGAAARVLHLLATPVRLVREGDADLDGTYPERQAPTGAEAALQGAVTTSLITSAASGPH